MAGWAPPAVHVLKWSVMGWFSSNWLFFVLLAATATGTWHAAWAVVDQHRALSIKFTLRRAAPSRRPDARGADGVQLNSSSSQEIVGRSARDLAADSCACSRSWVELQDVVVHIVADLHDGSLVAASIAVIRCAENGHQGVKT